MKTIYTLIFWKNNRKFRYSTTNKRMAKKFFKIIKRQNLKNWGLTSYNESYLQW